MICIKCKVDKPLFDFSNDKPRPNGKHPYCKACCKEKRDLNRENILEKKRLKKFDPVWREKRRLYSNKYYDKNKVQMREQMAEYYGEVENRKKKILWSSKERAKESGIEWDLTIEDIVIPDVCPYLGIPLTHTIGDGFKQTNSSIDRIDPNKGYVKGNVQIISRKANTMKNCATKEELITFATNILKLYENQFHN